MVELILVVTGVVIMGVVWRVRIAGARKKLMAIDKGEMCLACDSPEVAVTGDEVRCQACGHVASLRKLRAAKLSQEEYASATAPDFRNRY